MTRINKKDHANLSIDVWNVTTFHAYLIDINAERFNAEYVPFGKGSITNRWSFEKGAIKNAQAKYGNAVLKRFIDVCFDGHRPSRDYPHINFGFMWSYMRDNMPRVQAEIAKEHTKKEKRSKRMSDDDVDAVIDLI